MKERFQQLIGEQVQQASEIAALKKKVEDGDNNVNALKENHRKEMELVRNDLRTLDKLLTVRDASSVPTVKEKFKREIKRKYTGDIDETIGRLGNVENIVAKRRTGVKELQSSHSRYSLTPNDSTEHGYNTTTENINISQTEDATPEVTMTNNRRMMAQRRRSENRISDVNVKRTYYYDWGKLIFLTSSNGL